MVLAQLNAAHALWPMNYVCERVGEARRQVVRACMRQFAGEVCNGESGDSGRCELEQILNERKMRDSVREIR